MPHFGRLVLEIGILLLDRTVLTDRTSFGSLCSPIKASRPQWGVIRGVLC